MIAARVIHLPLFFTTSRGGAVVACRAHNPKVVGSNPAPATNRFISSLDLKFNELFSFLFKKGSDPYGTSGARALINAAAMAPPRTSGSDPF